MFSFRHAHGARILEPPPQALAAAADDIGGPQAGVDPTALQEVSEQGGSHGIPSVDY